MTSYESASRLSAPGSQPEACPLAELLPVIWKKKKKCCKSWKKDKRCKKCPGH